MNNPFDFSGKVAVITGGSGILCGAMSQALAACGAHVVVVGYQRIERARGLVEEINQTGGSAIAVQADVLSKPSIGGLLNRTLKEFGQVDFLTFAICHLCRFSPIVTHLPENNLRKG